MDKGEEESEHLLLEEARRQLDYQLQRNSEIKDEAATLLRVLFTFVGTLGGILTVVAYLVAAGIIDPGTETFIPSFDQSVNNYPYLSAEQWEWILFSYVFSPDGFRHCLVAGDQSTGYVPSARAN